MDKIRINTEKAQKEFLKHLKIEGNERIIFSGQFGIGKTTFLKEFKEAHKDKYRIFHLFPVNYSVASNEDIFELVKYDLFYEVLEHLVEEEKTDLLGGLDMSKKEFLPFFLAQNWDSIARSFLKFIPKVGKSITDFIDEYEKLKSLFDSKFDEFKENNGELIKLFSEDIESKTGQIYEFDQFSELLKELIKDLNSEGNKRDNVLIIDDLDRVDPDHIFRLLNVFAAHVDFDKGDSNKFGFDRIVFVMDINNVRRIFENRYGQDVDFSGYIDKFYSQEVYQFNILPLVQQVVGKVLSSIESSESGEGDFENDARAVYGSSMYLIQLFIKTGSLNLRGLLKIEGLSFSIKNNIYLIEVKARPIKTHQLNVLILVQFLSFVLGSTLALKLAIKRSLEFVQNKNIDIQYDKTVEYMFGDLLPIIDFTQFPFEKSISERRYTLFSDLENKIVEYVPIHGEGRMGARVKRVFIESVQPMGMEEEEKSSGILVKDYLEKLLFAIDRIEEYYSVQSS